MNFIDWIVIVSICVGLLITVVWSWYKVLSVIL